MKSELTKLCEELGITATSVYGTTKPLPENFRDCHPYTVTLRFGRRRMTVPFYMGSAHTDEPTASDVLGCLCLRRAQRRGADLRRVVLRLRLRRGLAQGRKNLQVDPQDDRAASAVSRRPLPRGRGRGVLNSLFSVRGPSLDRGNRVLGEKKRTCHR
jgi:hypothetical protein